MGQDSRWGLASGHIKHAILTPFTEVRSCPGLVANFRSPRKNPEYRSPKKRSGIPPGGRASRIPIPRFVGRYRGIHEPSLMTRSDTQAHEKGGVRVWIAAMSANFSEQPNVNLDENCRLRKIYLADEGSGETTNQTEWQSRRILPIAMICTSLLVATPRTTGRWLAPASGHRRAAASDSEGSLLMLAGGRATGYGPSRLDDDPVRRR